MERIYLYSPSTKKAGKVKLRFRLYDGRKVEIYHKSDIIADVSDLSKIDKFGKKYPRKVLSSPRLEKDIAAEIQIMSDVYQSMRKKGQTINSTNFEKEIDDWKNPEKALRSVSLLTRFDRFIEGGLRDGIFGQRRYMFYRGAFGKMERFLTIAGQPDISAEDFNVELLLAFRQFVFDEYQYVTKFRSLYKTMKDRDIPKQRRSENTIGQVMKGLQSFFNELEDRGEITKSPFRYLGKERRRAVMKSKYDTPICLDRKEFMQVLNSDVPETLAEVKDAFLLQCSLGCRIGDYKSLTMDNVSVDEDGIPYIHYLPEKTKNGQADNSENKTPIVRFALDIVKKWRMNFSILKYVSGKSGYNAKIKSLLKHCGIDREVAVFNSNEDGNTYLPLYECGSSKLARKTYVDMLTKIQVDPYAGGLHKRGSVAVNRYVDWGLKERFALASRAFGQEMYRTDKDLNIIK